MLDQLCLHLLVIKVHRLYELEYFTVAERRWENHSLGCQKAFNSLDSLHLITRQIIPAVPHSSRIIIPIFIESTCFWLLYEVGFEWG